MLCLCVFPGIDSLEALLEQVLVRFGEVCFKRIRCVFLVVITVYNKLNLGFWVLFWVLDAINITILVL